MVKPGYKQTEIGVIPEDWEESVFGRIVSIFRGSSPRPIQDYLTNSNDGVNWIKIGDIPVNGKYVTKTEEKIRPEGVSRSREVHSGDFILSNSMSFGRPYILKIDGCIHDGWLTIQNYASQFTTEYLYYLLSSNKIYTQYMAMAAGSSVKNLNKEKVGSLIVIYPKTPEQRRIAKALSDMDELIFSLEKLIAKKKAIKKGVMQELLTGKMRLPGFNRNWMTVSIGECGWLSKESINPQLFSSEYFWEYSMPAFDESKRPTRQLGKNMHSNRIRIAGNVLLFNKLNVRQKRIWIINESPQNSVCSSEFLPYYSNTIDLRFLKNILETDKATNLNYSPKPANCRKTPHSSGVCAKI